MKKFMVVFLMFSKVAFAGGVHVSNVDKFLEITGIKSEMDKDNESFRCENSYVKIMAPKNPSNEIKKSISDLFEAIDSSNYKKLLVENMTAEEINQALVQAERVRHIFKKVGYKKPTDGLINYDEKRLNLIGKLVLHSKDVIVFDSVGFEDGLIKNLSLKYTECSDIEIQELMTYYSHPAIQKERQLYIHFSMNIKRLTEELFGLFAKESKK